MIRRHASAAAVAVALVTLTACGSDDTPASASVSPVPASSWSSLESGSSSIPNTLPPPYIEGVDWVQTDVGPSLQVRPTANGRAVIGPTAGAKAWAEVLVLAPDGDTPGMKAQFDCHWTFARIAEPDKPSWNLEPGRPVVSEADMIAARCNPGVAEESD